MSRLTLTLGREPAWRLALRFAGLARDEVGRKIAHGLGVRRQAHVDVETLRLPDSSLCREATALVTELSTGMLLNHGVRSYAFGAALGRRDGRRFDPELLYLACIMHDLGLTERHAHEPRDFELVGASQALDFLRARGVAAERAETVHEAIALHARIGAATLAGPEAALTHLGAGLDVIGVRAEDFRPADVARIVSQWPRHGFKRCFAALVRDQADRKPDSNIAGHVRLGFTKRIAAAPFDE